MKKLLTFVFALVAVLGLASCGKAAVNPDKDYYAVGAFNGWGDSVGKAEAKMEAVASVKGLKIKNAKYIYAVDCTFSADPAGWSETIGEVEYDGNLAIKVVRTAAGDPESIDFWAQNKESGEVKNLSPETLVLGKYRETDTEEDGLGTWGSNAFVKEAGTFTIVFVEFADGSLGMGAVKK